MKRTILQKAAAAALFVLLTAALLAAADFLLVDDVHSYSRVMLQELYADAGNIDTLFLGSSHCYRSVDPAQVDAALGTHSFNAGSSQQLPDGSYYMLKEAAAQNPLKTVYLETFYTGYNQQKSSNVPLACYLITDYMRASSPYRYQYLWEMGGAAAFADLVFPARHAIADPGELPALWRGKLTGGYNAGNYDWVTYPDEGEAYRDRGFVYTEGTSIWGFGTLMHVDASAPISPFGRANLTRIAEFCKKQNIRLVLVTAPLPSAYVQDTQNYQAYVDAMRSFAAANGTQYWDFSLFKDTDLLPIGFDDFSDMHHLNGQGAETFSKAFATVAARSAAGENVSSLFYDTVAEKLATSPDSTVQQGGGQLMFSVTSLGFLPFMALFVCLWYRVPQPSRWKLVLAANAVFCLSIDIGAFFAVALATAVVWQAAQHAQPEQPSRRGWLALGLAAALLPLLVLKYSGMLVPGLRDLYKPFGLAYYSLQLAGYLLDVWHGRTAPTPSYARLWCYAGFFLSLTQGPFNRYNILMPQLEAAPQNV